MQYEENPSAGKHIAQLGEFAVALSRGEVDAENVDDVISNLDQLGLLPWDKTQVCIPAKLLFYEAHYLYLLQGNPRLTKLSQLAVITIWMSL